MSRTHTQSQSHNVCIRADHNVHHLTHPSTASFPLFLRPSTHRASGLVSRTLATATATATVSATADHDNITSDHNEAHRRKRLSLFAPAPATKTVTATTTATTATTAATATADHDNITSEHNEAHQRKRLSLFAPAAAALKRRFLGKPGPATAHAPAPVTTTERGLGECGEPEGEGDIEGDLEGTESAESVEDGTTRCAPTGGAVPEEEKTQRRLSLFAPSLSLRARWPVGRARASAGPLSAAAPAQPAAPASVTATAAARPTPRTAPLPITLSVYGHRIKVPQAVPGRSAACFSFADLCHEADDDERALDRDADLDDWMRRQEEMALLLTQMEIGKIEE